MNAPKPPQLLFGYNVLVLLFLILKLTSPLIGISALSFNAFLRRLIRE